MKAQPDHRNTPPPPVSGMRRRLLRGGLSSAPLLITLTSRPVLAATCYNPSETLSGALSHKGEDIPICNGDSVSTWLSQTSTQSGGGNKQTMSVESSWPIDPATPFHAIFARGSQANFVQGRQNGTAQDLSLLEVMQLRGNQDPYKIGAHFSAAYLNILAGRIDPRAMTTQGLTDLWREWVTTGYYTPYAGATPWYAQDIVAYFNQTGIASL